MDDHEKNSLRDRLKNELNQCKLDVVRLEKSASPIAPSNALGRLTRMDSLNDQGINLAALHQNQERLYQLEQALECIERPGFGACASCGQAIPVERLMAVPESTRCVACASRR